MVGECVYHGVDYWCCEKELSLISQKAARQRLY
jgi:hypothetical protein